MKINIIYEDEYLAVINKPINLTVHEGVKTKQVLTDLLPKYFTRLSNVDETRKGIVHRLDQDTEGLMLIAKENTIHSN